MTTALAASIAVPMAVAAPAGAAVSPFKVGEAAIGGMPGCAGVVTYDKVPFIDPTAVPTGGYLGPINHGTATFAPGPVGPPLGAPTISSELGTVTVASPLGNQAIKFNLTQTPLTPTGYNGKIRYSGSPLLSVTPSGAIDLGPLFAPGPVLLGGAQLSLMMSNPNGIAPGVPGPVAVTINSASVAAPGSALGVSVLYATADPATQCTFTYVGCVLLPANGLPPSPPPGGCPV